VALAKRKSTWAYRVQAIIAGWESVIWTSKICKFPKSEMSWIPANMKPQFPHETLLHEQNYKNYCIKLPLSHIIRCMWNIKINLGLRFECNSWNISLCICKYFK
jgi:hypothetical protein